MLGAVTGVILHTGDSGSGNSILLRIRDVGSSDRSEILHTGDSGSGNRRDRPTSYRIRDVGSSVTGVILHTGDSGSAAREGYLVSEMSGGYFIPEIVGVASRASCSPQR